MTPEGLGVILRVTLEILLRKSPIRSSLDRYKNTQDQPEYFCMTPSGRNSNYSLPHDF